MAAVGLTWFIGPFAHSDIPVVSEMGLALEDTTTVLLLALVLAYPSGRLTSRVDRVAVAILAIGATGLNLLFSTSLFTIDPGPTGLYGGVVLATMTTIVIVRRWLIAPARSRRELLPVLVAGLVFLAILMINLVRRIADVPEDVSAVLIAARDLAPAAIPVALLIGFYRQSERRLRAVVDAIPDRMVRFDRDGEYPHVAATVDEADTAERAMAPAYPRAGLHEALFGVAATDALGAAADALDTGRLQGYDFILDLPRRAARTGGSRLAERAERGHRDRPRLHRRACRRGRGPAIAGEDRGGDRRGAATSRARPPRRGAATTHHCVARPAEGARSALGPAGRRRGGDRGVRRSRVRAQDRDPGAA